MTLSGTYIEYNRCYIAQGLLIKIKQKEGQQLYRNSRKKFFYRKKCQLLTYKNKEAEKDRHHKVRG